MGKQAYRLFLLFFFGVQLIGILLGLFTEIKYFNWVPYDEISHYTITVSLPGGEQLNEVAIFQRYTKVAIILGVGFHGGLLVFTLGGLSWYYF